MTHLRTAAPPLAGNRGAIAQPESRWSDERACSWAAAAVAAFIVYGSLLPFDLGRPDTLSPLVLLGRIGTWPLRSSADLFVNVASGLPLGFFLTGALRSGKRRLGLPLTTLVVAFVSALLGTVVEAVQVLSPTRQSAWHDVLGQLIGAGLGIVAWTLAGPWATRSVRILADERSASLLAARLLQLFLPIYLFVQLTPILSTPLATSYSERTASVPIASQSEFTFPVLHNLAANALMNIPIGALAVLGWARRGTRRRAGPAMLLGISMMTAVEVAHGVVWSNDFGTTDLLAGGLGVATGIAAVEWWSRPRATRRARRWHLAHPWLVAATAAWMLGLMVQYGHAFDLQVTAEFVVNRYRVVQLIPFKAYYPGYAATPLTGLHEIVVRCLGGVPLGMLLRLSYGGSGRRDGFLSTIATATIVLVGIEIAQVFLPIPHEFPDLTDVILGVTGAAIGSAAGAALVRRKVASDAARTERRTADVASGQGGLRHTARADERCSMSS